MSRRRRGGQGNGHVLPLGAVLTPTAYGLMGHAPGGSACVWRCGEPGCRSGSTLVRSGHRSTLFQFNFVVGTLMRTWMWYVTAVWMVWYCDDVPALTTFDGCGRVEAVVSGR